jgi:hypothetical protein
VILAESRIKVSRILRSRAVDRHRLWSPAESTVGTFDLPVVTTAVSDPADHDDMAQCLSREYVVRRLETDSYLHTLWSTPGTGSAQVWVTGRLAVITVAQP